MSQFISDLRVHICISDSQKMAQDLIQPYALEEKVAN